MGLFDGRMKEFAAQLVTRLEAYANAQTEVSKSPDTGESEASRANRKAAALALHMVSRAIKDVAEIQDESPVQ